MKLLHIDASILGADSVSRTISSAIVARLKNEIPDLAITSRDLAAAPLSHLSGTYLAGRAPGAVTTPETQADIAQSDQALAEFLAADIVVIGAPMYNFTVPTQLKAWIDRIVVAGQTFRYGEAGPEGLVGNKRVIIALSRGGLYGADTPLAVAEHVETYLRTIFGFIGVRNPEIIIAEGVQMGPDAREAAVARALAATQQLHAA